MRFVYSAPISIVPYTTKTAAGPIGRPAAEDPTPESMQVPQGPAKAGELPWGFILAGVGVAGLAWWLWKR